MTSPWPIDPEALAVALAERIYSAATPSVIAIDGAPATSPSVLAEAVLGRLRSLGAPAAHVQSRWFWRDASVRLEYGHEDVDAYLEWLDYAALRREAIQPMHARGDYLPSLRDPSTNRATRAQPASLGPRGVLIISGAFLLREDLELDLSVHLWASPSALARRTSVDQTWTLPAFARYELETQPARSSSVVVRCDDPRHPAVLGL